MFNSIELTKHGLRVEVDGRTGYLVPETGLDLLQLWHWIVGDIDPEYTLGDLLALLRSLRNAELLPALLGCDVPSFLDEGRLAPTPDDDGPDYLEVFNEPIPAGYEEDPRNPDEPERFLEGAAAEEHEAMMRALFELIGEQAAPLSAPAEFFDADDPFPGKPLTRRYVPGSRNGKWCGPFHIHRGFHGVGRWREPYPGFLAAHPEIDPRKCVNGFALGLVPVNELAHRPLRYNPEIIFGDERREGAAFRERITITFGELVHAIFGVLGLAGDPRTRDAFREAVERRADEIMEEIARKLGDLDAGWC